MGVERVGKRGGAGNLRRGQEVSPSAMSALLKAEKPRERV